MGLGNWSAVWEEGKKLVQIVPGSVAWTTRWEKKTLSTTNDARDRSRFGLKINMGTAENRSQVFGDK
jgi:hypothetical protein